MSSYELATVAIEALRLQNGYAYAIDTRDWDYFRSVFSPDVVAEYPHNRWEGIDDWLSSFVPFHDGCLWTEHALTNHLVGEDVDGLWASCYGFVQWILRDEPNAVNRATTLFRDRLREENGRLVIARRKLDLLISQPALPIPDGQIFLNSILDLVHGT